VNSINQMEDMQDYLALSNLATFSSTYSHDS
jgi:hypothetical protein